MSKTYRSSAEVILRTPEWARAIDFYRSVLHLKVILRTETIVGFETGAFRLYVEKGVSQPPVFEFLVADVPAAKSALLAAGCTLEEEDASVPRCYVRDPFGMLFNLARERMAG